MEKVKNVNRFMFLYFLWYALPFQFLLAVGAQLLSYFCINLSDSFYYVNLMLMQDFLLMLLPILFMAYCERDRLSELLPLKSLTLWNVCYIVMTGLLMLPVMTFISVVTSLFYPDNSAWVTDEILSSSPAVGFIVMAVCPALFEETVFRGFVFGGLKRFGVKGAVLLSAFYFGLFHMNLYQIPYAVFAGCIMAVVVYYTGSIFASVLLHLVINGIQVLEYYLVMGVMENSEELLQTEQTAVGLTDIVSYGIRAVVFGGLLFLMLRGFVRYNKIQLGFKAPETEKGCKLIDGWFLASVVVCLVYMTAAELLFY